MLLGICVHVPLKILELVSDSLPQKLKEEVETHFTFTHITIVFMDLQLHHLEVEEVRFLRRVEHSDFDTVIPGLEKSTTELVNSFVSLNSSFFVPRMSFFQHSIEKI